MDHTELAAALTTFKLELERAVVSSRYGGQAHANGVDAKNAAIRSGTLISLLHEVVKSDLHQALIAAGLAHTIHPPIGHASPELGITGLIKAKKQDVVALVGALPRRETIADGPLLGTVDPVGRHASERAIVVGVRSQLSSVNKNFDTLMERAFAETLNLRLRLPRLAMGEVYLIPAYEYDDEPMKRNRVAWKRAPVNIGRFIRTFAAISGREAAGGADDLFKYERTALVVADFRATPVTLFLRGEDLLAAGLVDRPTAAQFDMLRPTGFGDDLVRIYRERFA